MKEKFSIMLGMLLMLLLFVTGCKEMSVDGQKEVKEIRVGILLYNQDDMFINVMKQKLDAGFREKENEEDFKITFNFSDAKGSQTVQNDQIDKYILQEYDVLCINLVDRTDAAMIIDKGKKAGIPIVFFNREPVAVDMNRWDEIYYVGVETENGGKLQGEIFLEEYETACEQMDRNGDGVIQYVILEGEPGHQDATIRTESCLKTIQEGGVELERLDSFTANWRRSPGKEAMEGWLHQFGDEIELVLSNNDEMALGALDAIAGAGIPDGQIKVIGLDGIEEAVQAVKDGKMLGTVLNDAEGQVNGIIDLAVALGKGEEPKQVKYLDESRYVRVPHSKIK